jgi:thiol-activated cytolysin
MDMKLILKVQFSMMLALVLACCSQPTGEGTVATNKLALPSGETDAGETDAGKTDNTQPVLIPETPVQVELVAQIRSLSIPRNLAYGASEPLKTTLISTKDTSTRIKEETWNLSGKLDSQLLLSPSDVIFPGSVLLGDSVSDGTYKGVSAGERKPVIISYSFTGVTSKTGEAGAVSAVLDPPTLSGYREAHNKIVTQNISDKTTQFEFDMTEITSENQYEKSFSIGVGFSSLTVKASLQESYNFRSSTFSHKYLAKFIQPYYTVDVDNGGFLYEAVDVSVFGAYRPVYVSSLTYGRLAYVAIESNRQESAVSNDIQASLKFPLSDGDVTGNIRNRRASSDRLQSDKLSIYVIGDEKVFTDIDGFGEFLVTEGFSEDNFGKIISYRLRFVDDNSIANVVVDETYTISRGNAVDHN